MPAVPKRRIPRGRRDRRRAQTFKLAALRKQVVCECGELVLPYHVCPNCGRYRGRQILDIEKK